MRTFWEVVINTIEHSTPIFLLDFTLPDSHQCSDRRHVFGQWFPTHSFDRFVPESVFASIPYPSKKWKRFSAKKECMRPWFLHCLVRWTQTPNWFAWPEHEPNLLVHFRTQKVLLKKYIKWYYWQNITNKSWHYYSMQRS